MAAKKRGGTKARSKKAKFGSSKFASAAAKASWGKGKKTKAGTLKTRGQIEYGDDAIGGD